MKKALRDVLLIVLLFGAILAAPVLMRAFPGSEMPAKTLPQAQQVSAVVPVVGRRAATTNPPLEASGGPSGLNQLAPEEAASTPPNCPGITFGSRNAYDPHPATGGAGDTFVADAETAAAMRLDGGGGVDTIRITGPGNVNADGAHIVSMEIYNLDNGKPNTLHILAGGLAAMDGRHAVVIGDSQGDTVFLDPCLAWDQPVAVNDGPEPMLRYDARDAEGNQASVSVTKGVTVVSPTQR